MRKNFSVWLMIFSFVFAFVLVPKVTDAAKGTADLIIYHTNDMHARILPEDDSAKSIGLAELVAVVKAGKAKNPDTLWLDAGDTLHGMPIINVSRGENMIPLLNAAKLDEFTPGNHDFNYGSAQLEKIAKKLKFAVLDANVVRKNDHSKLLFKPYKIFKMPNDITVGVFGLSTPECAYKTSPKNVATLDFLNPVDVSREMIKELRPKCDVLIAVMHMGLDASSEFTSERIAKEAPGIDLIVDGHSHTALFDGLTVGNTLIVQTGWHDYALGRVKLIIRDHKITAKQAQLLTKSEVKDMAIKPDPEITKAIAKVQAKTKKLFETVVAHTDRALTSNRLILRRSESELGNLCADMLRWRANADIGLINGGGMRTDLPAGNVTRGDTLAIFPFGNTIRKAEMDGKTLRQVLEHSVYGYPASFGGFLDVSGMTFSFDPTEPAGQRVKEVTVGGQPLDDNKIYTVAATDFFFMGGDDYDMVKNLKIVGEFDTCEDALADYLNQVGMPDIELGRIKLIKEIALPNELPEGQHAYVEEKKAA